MLLHFIVISLFEESWAAEAKVGPMDPDLAHQSVAQTLRRAGIRASGWPLDPMWYLMREGKIIGYVKVFREEMYARNWFRDLAEKEGSKNFWAFWRDGHPLALVDGANAKDANQFVKSMMICRVRAFSAQSAAENGWKNWISGKLTAIEIFRDRPRGSTDQKAKPSIETRPSPQNEGKRSATVEPSKWQVTRENIAEGKRPSEELSRTYTLSGLAPPETTATVRIVCKLVSEGLVGDIESETGGLNLYRQLRFYLRPFRLPHDADFVMGLSTVDRSKGGEFDVTASPVDSEASVFAKFGGRNDVRTCLDVLMSGDDMLFTVSDETESLVKFRLPNDGEFKQLADEAFDRLARTEFAYRLMRSQPRR
jgi:hypothetical protein